MIVADERRLKLSVPVPGDALPRDQLRRRPLRLIKPTCVARDHRVFKRGGRFDKQDALVKWRAQRITVWPPASSPLK